jgi:2'-5' RNA ligase
LTDIGTTVGAPAAPRHAAVGFERYAVVTFATTQICEDLRKVRAQCAPSGRPLMDAHVTVKGGFLDLRDLDAALRAIGEAVAWANPFAIRTTDPQVLTRGDRASIVLPLEESRALRAMHDRLVEALAPHGVHDSQQDLPGAYAPHVTVVQNVPIDGLERSVRAVEGWRLNYFWTVRDVDLVGLRDGLWQSLRVFRFGRPRPFID